MILFAHRGLTHSARDDIRIQTADCAPRARDRPRAHGCGFSSRSNQKADCRTRSRDLEGRRPICLHDDTLRRTTNVERCSPIGYSRESTGRDGARRWFANDFTLAEIKTLDAASWRDRSLPPRVCPRGRKCSSSCAARPHYPELKSPPLYSDAAWTMVKISWSREEERLDRPESLR